MGGKRRERGREEKGTGGSCSKVLRGNRRPCQLAWSSLGFINHPSLFSLCIASPLESASYVNFILFTFPDSPHLAAITWSHTLSALSPSITHSVFHSRLRISCVPQISSSIVCNSACWFSQDCILRNWTRTRLAAYRLFCFIFIPYFLVTIRWTPSAFLAHVKLLYRVVFFSR